MSAPPQHPALGKTSRAIGVMLALLSVPYAHASMRPLRILRAPWDAADPDPVAAAPVVPAPVATIGESELRASDNHGTLTNALPQSEEPALDPQVLAKTAGSIAVEDASGHALDAFYTQLGRTLSKEPGAITRVLHYGDSMIASDYVSGTMRRRMQARYGDAGHGFILTANGWDWYFHNDVVHRASDGWSLSRITGPLASDGLFGLGGVSFHTSQRANATFATLARGEFGKAVSRFDVYYLEQPGGGDFELSVKGSAPERVSTAGPAKVSRKRSVTVPDGAGELTLRAIGGGDVRTFGVVMEREAPGVTYDALGALGGRASLWKTMNAEHWREQLTLRQPALIVLQYGTNESEDGGVNEPEYEKTLGTLIDTLRASAPFASVLVAAPLDRAEKAEDGSMRSPRVIVRIVELQKKIAAQHGVAFWNTFEAMGGKGSMAKWVAKGLGGADLTHPTPQGAQLVGDLFFKALSTGHDAFASAHRGSPATDSGRD